MGRAKASLPLGGDDTFLTRIVRTFLAAGVDDVVVVVGHEADDIVTTFVASGLPARFVVNRDYDRGHNQADERGEIKLRRRPRCAGDRQSRRKQVMRGRPK